MAVGTVQHPARFSQAILDAIEPIVWRWRLPVHDPFAGTGVRLGAVCDKLGLVFTGTEIEVPFIVDERVRFGDSTSASTYPTGSFCVVTSPVYPNGMADHFHAADDSERHTYRQAVAAITGADRPLHERNMGRYGVRSGRRAEKRHFDLARQALDHWPDRVVVNVSDFIAGGEQYELVDRWRELLAERDYAVTDAIAISTPRQRNGANSALRCDHETVLVGDRDLTR